MYQNRTVYELAPEFELLPEWAYESENGTANSTPPLLREESSAIGHTFYVKIDLGYGQNAEGKSFRITPQTGIFIPKSFDASRPTDIVLYLHGYKSSYPGDSAAMDKYWDGAKFPFFALREEVARSGTNVIFVAPTLGPKSQAGNLVRSGGFDKYMSQVVAAIEEYVVRKKDPWQGLLLNKIVLSAHSGGGSPMLRITRLKDNYTAQIAECWGFDSLYQGADEWAVWAGARPGRKLYVYYLGSTADNARKLKTNAARKGSSNIVVAVSSKGHYWVPVLHLKERLEALGGKNAMLQNENGQAVFYEVNGADAEPVPFKNVPFAPLPQAGAYWPLVSREPDIVNYRSVKGQVGSSPGRNFGARRTDGNGNWVRNHVAVDLFAKAGDPVVACYAGKITGFFPFCCGTKKTSNALIVDHGHVVINYGEVAQKLAGGLKVGDRVAAGQVIGHVGVNPNKSSMLHFEMYKAGTSKTWSWKKDLPASPSLYDPTKFLLQLRRTGLRGTSVQAPASQPTPAAANTGGNANQLIRKAIKGNEKYSVQLGWLKEIYAINQLLGFSNISPVPERFAEAVVRWQKTNGFTGNDVDGIIGPKTWKAMRSRLGGGAVTATNTGTAPAATNSSEVKVEHTSYNNKSMFGAAVKSTVAPRVEEIRDGDDIIVHCISSLEGGYDSINMYDRGIISFGIMQWTVHQGSLQDFFAFIKSKISIPQFFGGLDINDKRELTYVGKVYPKKENLSLIKLFRNSTDPAFKDYDKNVSARWAKIFALAGRNLAIQKLQVEYTRIQIRNTMQINIGKKMRAILADKNLAKYRQYINAGLTPDSTIEAYLGNNLKGKALFFCMWTNNPLWSYIKFQNALTDFLKYTGLPANAESWNAGHRALFTEQLEKTLRATTVANWGDGGGSKGRAGKVVNKVKELSVKTGTKQ
jgi:murein DD-endopeptidase MepM/ murein hydrolase activator NlpD